MVKYGIYLDLIFSMSSSLGFATRKCTNSGWMRPNVMQCDTYEFMSIRESVS